MKTKALLIASGIVLTGGIAMHTGNRDECPFGKPCQKLFKSETAFKPNKTVQFAKTEADVAVKK
jgi:hypothetical protein